MNMVNFAPPRDGTAPVKKRMAEEERTFFDFALSAVFSKLWCALVFLHPYEENNKKLADGVNFL